MGGPKVQIGQFRNHRIVSGKAAVFALASLGMLFAAACGDGGVKPTPVPSARAEATTQAESAPASLPAYRDPVVQEWSRYNSECRGGSGANSDLACTKRDNLTLEVEARGWCYARGPEGGFDWLGCSEVAETAAREEQESRRKLDLIGNVVPPRSSASSERLWYVAAGKLGRCEDLRTSIGVSTPDGVVSLFAANNMPLEFVRRDDLIVIVREAGNPNDPGMAFVRGYESCLSALALLDAAR